MEDRSLQTAWQYFAGRHFPISDADYVEVLTENRHSDTDPDAVKTGYGPQSVYRL